MAARSARVKNFLSLFARLKEQPLPADELLQAVVEAVARAMGTEVATLYVFDARAGELVLAATRGLPRSAVGFVALRLGEGLSGLSALRREPIVAPDVTREPSFKVIPGFDQRRYRSMLCVPLLDGARLVGALNVQTVAVYRYGPRDVEDLLAIGAAFAPLLADLLRGDLALRLRGPSVLSELDGIVAAAQGAVEVCARLVARLRLLFPRAQCTVALHEASGALTLIGDDLAGTERALLQECMAAAAPRQAPRGEGGRVFVLPLAVAGEALGALLIAGDTPEESVTGAYQVEYLETLAMQAAIALDRLTTRVAPENNARHLVDFDELTRLVLDDSGLDALVARASELCGARLAVVDVAGTVIAGTMPDVICATSELRAGETLLGRLLSAGAADQREIATIARVIALELSKWKVRFDVETRLRGDVLDLLLTGDWEDEQQVAARAGLAGIDLSRSYILALLAFDTAALVREHGALAMRAIERAVQRLCGEPPATVTFVRPEGLLLLLDAKYDAASVQRGIAQALLDVRLRLGGLQVAAGIGPLCTQPREYGPAYRQAAMAARLAQRLRATQPVHAAQIGIYRLLLAIESAQTLREFVDDVLGPILRQEGEAYGHELVRTLEAYYASAERLRPAARTLFIHVNTLKYRLARIEALTGRRLENAADRLDLYVALHALRLLEPEHDSLLADNVAPPDLSTANEASRVLAATVGQEERGP